MKTLYKITALCALLGMFCTAQTAEKTQGAASQAVDMQNAAANPAAPNPSIQNPIIQNPSIQNQWGMRFVQIPAGSFLMGSSAANAAAREKPQHRENIKAFYLGVYEVSQADWQAVMGFNPYELDRSNPFYALPNMAARITKPAHPATVSWLDAQDFIGKLNELDDTYRYRLPTEAEWEYAARAGTTTRYFFGDSDRELGEYAWFGGDFATGGTHPVGSKKPNPWGLYDIYGNAWEWVQDDYRPDYMSAATTDKTVRGGSWHATADGWHSAWRKPYPADYRGISIGFRLVAEPK